MTTIILALKFLQDMTGFQFLSKQFPQKKKKFQAFKKKDPGTEMAKSFFGGLREILVQKPFQMRGKN